MSPRRPVLGAVNWRRVGHVVGLVALVLVVFAFVAASFPAVVGADEAFVVRSDSMSPTVNAGAVVFVDEVPPTEVAVGDVVTFRTGAGEANRVTHRVIDIVENGERRFRTKGDAVSDPDPGTVGADQLVGVVSFHLPLIGRGISVAGSSVGVLAFVVVPAVALVLLELWDLATADDSGGGRLG